MSIGPDDDTIPNGIRPIPEGMQPWTGPCVPGLPCGKGVFVRHVKHGGDPELFAKRCEYLGFRWVMIQAIWQKPGGKVFTNNVSNYPDYAAALREVGVTPWVWGWPRPERVSEFVGACMHALHQLGAAGIVINPEHPWRGKGDGKTEEAALLAAQLRQALGDRPWGMTSYGGGPGYIESFPWAQFSACDFAIPQLYDWHHKQPSTYPVMATKRWMAGGYRRIIPALGGGASHSPPDMAEHAAETPYPDGACCWWDLYHLLQSKGRSEFVRSFEIPQRGGAVA